MESTYDEDTAPGSYMVSFYFADQAEAQDFLDQHRENAFASDGPEWTDLDPDDYI